VDPSGLNFKDDDNAIARTEAIAIDAHKAVTVSSIASSLRTATTELPIFSPGSPHSLVLSKQAARPGPTRQDCGNLRSIWKTLVRKPAKETFDPKVFLAKVGTGKKILGCQKNQIIFTQGEIADSIFYVQTGRVKLTVLSEEGKEAIVGIFEPGQFFGEGCLNGHPLRIGTTMAMEDCVITSITKHAMIAVLHDEPKFSELFMAYLLTRNSRIEEDLVDQLFNSSEKRLARLLLLLANFGKDGPPQPVLAEISQETLAEMIGTTRSRVSFFMNKFRKLGLIDYNGKIKVHNSLLNAVLHDNPRISALRAADTDDA
jgi:CRP/FNR family cyclic AMP-dependent transcriptional regulator